MKKKYSIVILVLVLVILSGIFGVSKFSNKDEKNDFNKKNPTSITVDDPTGNSTNVKDESGSEDGEIDTWIEAVGDDTSNQSSTTDNSEKDTSSVDKQETSDDDDNNKTNSNDNKNDNNQEDNKEDNKEEKPEWIGGDF